jgi:endonuclease G
MTPQHPHRELMFTARALARTLIGHNGVIGVDIGTKYKKNSAQKSLAIRFLVDEKLSPAKLKKIGRQGLPPQVLVGKRLVPTDVIQASPTTHYLVVDKIPSQEERKQRLDPVRPGCSIGGRMGDAGTLGMIVYDRDTGEPMALSNWHVLDLGGGVGADIHQPGPLDEVPSPATLLGSLVRSHRGLAGDCAVAKIANRDTDGSMMGIGATPVRIADPEHGDLVVKSGRTSGVTIGQIEGIGLTMSIEYTGLKVLIGGILTIQPVENETALSIAKGGDSGSVWLAIDGQTPTDVAIGLHFGGDEHRNVAYACALRPVMTKLRVLPVPP